MSEKSIGVKELFEFKKPKYIYLKLTPSNSVRNNDSDKFITIVACLYKTINKQIQIINRKLFFECNEKASYYIYMEAGKCVDFYFIVPEKHYTLFRDKISDIWKNKITITNVSELPLLSTECTKYYMTYKKKDALSLNCDKRNNVLLSTQLNTLNSMQYGDKLAIFYNFYPMENRSWRDVWDRTIKEYKNDMPIYKADLSFAFVIKTGFSLLAKLLDFGLSCIDFSDGKGVQKSRADVMISENSKRKRNAPVVCAQIICLSDCDDKSREQNNALSLCTSFECLEDDNKLVYKKIKSNEINLLDKRIKHTGKIIIQPREAQNFIGLPGRELLDEFKCIECTNVLESPVPDELKCGYIRLGKNLYKGNKTNAYLPDDHGKSSYDKSTLPVVMIGEQGCGKSTAISNTCFDICNNGEGFMLTDFIKGCELSESIIKHLPKDRVIEIDMTDIVQIQGIGYNELKPKTSNPIERYDIAGRKTLYMQMLIDAVNTSGEVFTAAMDRIFSACCQVVLLQDNTSIKDVVRCLNNHVFRAKCIDSIPKELLSIMEDEIVTLHTLDKCDGSGNVIGTATNSTVEGINSRINILKKDLRLKMMFNKDCKDNFDLVKAMDEGKCIFVKMNQEYFGTPYAKNVVVTYWFTKLWCATLIRGSRDKLPKRFHMIIDEVFQSPTVMQMLNKHQVIPQTRKFGLVMRFSCQNIAQIKEIDITLRSAGSNYMLMKGSGKSNFNEFKEELAPYALEDLEAMKQYDSLNIINTHEGRVKFITSLPKPL